jgi:hypothetical protein
LPTVKNGVFLAGTNTLSPVFGFRPSRDSRVLTMKLPNPRISIRSPWAIASVMLSKMLLTTSSTSFLERLGYTAAILAINWLLVTVALLSFVAGRPPRAQLPTPGHRY